MQEFLPFIVIGLATGAVYGLAGIGLMLTYKTSGIFNFGYGAIAALVAFCYYFLNRHGLPWGAAAAISLGVFAPILGLILELMARALAGADETLKVVATVGFILIVGEPRIAVAPGQPADLPSLPAAVNGADARRERHLGTDNPVPLLRRGGRGAVLVLPVGPLRHPDAGRGR